METSENVTTRKMSTYWITVLLLNGINVYPGNKNKGVVKRVAAVYPWFISACWLFIITTVMPSLVLQHPSYVEVIELLTYITGSFCTLVMFAIGVYKRPQLNRMLHIVWHEFRHDVRRVAADTLYWQFVRTYGIIMPVTTVLMCMTPVAWAANYGNINSPAAMIINMWTPWTRLTAAEYAAVYTAQFVVSLSVMINIGGMVFAMVVFVNEMQVQMDIITDAVRDLNMQNHRQRPWVAFYGLIGCVKHHQTLIEYFNNFKSYFNILFVVDIVYIMIMTCLCASSMLFANGFSAYHIKMLSLLMVVVFQFFFYCLIGEKFSMMNTQFGDCIYFKLADCRDPKLLRMATLVILRTQKPLQLTAMGISKYMVSLSTFAVSMKSAYAGLNMLYNVKKNISS